MANKLLSVTVAAFNAEKYLREVLDSFVNLTRIDEVEVFVVDDGGTDSSLDIAKEYESRFPGVFIPVHKENGGWGSTVNYSMKHASGKYFKILDGDDYFHAEHLEEFIEYLSKMDADVIISPYTSFRDGTDNELSIAGSFDPAYKVGEIYPVAKIDKDFTLAMHAITVRTSLLSGFSLKEKVVYRDMEFTANVLLKADSYCFFDKFIYCYRLGRDGQSVSRESYIKHMEEHGDVVLAILQASKKTDDPAKIRLLYKEAVGAYIQQYRIYFYPEPKKYIKKKLQKFNGTVQKEFPEFYRETKLPKPYSLFQKGNFRSYFWLASAVTLFRKVKKLIRRG